MKGFALVAVALTACTELTPAGRATVFAFMECVDCRGGERQQVAAIGDSAVPLLQTFLLTGPPAPRVTRVKRSVSATLFGDSTPPPQASPDLLAVLQLQVEDYQAQYQWRAAIALEAIGTPPARQALCQAAGRPFRPLVVAAVDSALARLQHQCA